MGKKARNAGKKASKVCTKPSMLEMKLLMKSNPNPVLQEFTDQLRPALKERGEELLRVYKKRRGREVRSSEKIHTEQCYYAQRLYKAMCKSHPDDEDIKPEDYFA